MNPNAVLIIVHEWYFVRNVLKVVHDIPGLVIYERAKFRVGDLRFVVFPKTQDVYQLQGYRLRNPILVYDTYSINGIDMFFISQRVRDEKPEWVYLTKEEELRKKVEEIIAGPLI